jgi:hypothetical protein
MVEKRGYLIPPLPQNKNVLHCKRMRDCRTGGGWEKSARSVPGMMNSLMRRFTVGERFAVEKIEWSIAQSSPERLPVARDNQRFLHGVTLSGEIPRTGS